MPKVSIVIPIYNVKDYMAASVQSAINQTEQDIEVILVDDGSTDGSQQLCDQYAESDSRIRVIHKENGGLSSARNSGVKIASAEYVLLLDGDDYLHEKTVQRLLDVVAKYPSDIVQFQYVEVPGVELLPDVGEVRVVAQAKTPEEAFRYLYQWGGVCASGCTKLFRKQLLVDTPFESIRHEDEMWCTRAFPKNLTITYIPDILYGYVMRPGSIIHSGFHSGRMDILKVKEERLKTLSELELTQAEIEEWNRLFATLLMLYRDAKKAGEKEYQEKICHYFKCIGVVDRVKLCGRITIFHWIARLNVRLALEIYCFYWGIGH